MPEINGSKQMVSTYDGSRGTQWSGPAARSTCLFRCIWLSAHGWDFNGTSSDNNRALQLPSVLLSFRCF